MGRREGRANGRKEEGEGGCGREAGRQAGRQVGREGWREEEDHLAKQRCAFAARAPDRLARRSGGPAGCVLPSARSEISE